MMDEIDANEEQLLAAEYALGLLAPQEAAAFEVLLSEDAAFRADYARWAEDFAAMADDIDPVAPPDDLLSKVKQAVFVPEVDTEGFVTVAVNEARDSVEPVQPVATDADTMQHDGAASGTGLADKAQSWLQRLGMLPAMAGGLAAAMLVLWLVNVSGVFSPAPIPGGSVTLASADNSLIVDVIYSEDGKTLDITRTAGGIPEGQSLQLWLINGDAAPVSLGLLPESETATLDVAYNLRTLLRGASCAISVEPPGGSPTGAPTGDVIAMAPIVWS